jgi:hypothetical protein
MSHKEEKWQDRRELEVAKRMQHHTFHMVPLLSTDSGSIGLVFYVRSEKRRREKTEQAQRSTKTEGPRGSTHSEKAQGGVHILKRFKMECTF